MSIFTDIENFITTKAWPFLKNIGKSVVQAESTALAPIATELVAGAEQAIVSAATNGQLGSLGSTLGSLVTQTAVKAEAAGISAGATSIFTALGTALATNPTTANNLAVTAKPAS